MGIVDKVKTSVRGWFGFYPTGYLPPVNAYDILVGTDNALFISPASALNFTPVYRAVNLISNDIARTPGEFENPSLQRIWDRPNRFQSGFDFRRQITMQALLYGNSFALINRKKSGEIYELVPLPIGSVQLDITRPTPFYKVNGYGDIPAENILHIKAAPLEGLWDKAMERQRGKGTLEDLYEWYRKNSKVKNPQSIMDIQLRKPNTKGLEYLF